MSRQFNWKYITISVAFLIIITAVIVSIMATSDSGSAGRGIVTLESALLGHWEDTISEQSTGYHCYFSQIELFFAPEGSDLVWNYSYRCLDSNEKGDWIKFDIYHTTEAGYEKHYPPVVLQFSPDRRSFSCSEDTAFPGLKTGSGTFKYMDNTQKPSLSGQELTF